MPLEHYDTILGVMFLDIREIVNTLLLLVV